MHIPIEEIEAFHTRIGALPGTYVRELYDIVRELRDDGAPDERAAMAQLRKWWDEAPEMLERAELPALAYLYRRPRLWITLLWAQQNGVSPARRES